MSGPSEGVEAVEDAVPADAVRAIRSYHPQILASVEGWVATVTIDNPDAKNGCSGDMFVALGETFRDLGQSGVRAIVLTGSGGNFCAGADLSAVGASGAGGGPSATMTDAMRVLADVVVAVHDCPVPVVAKVDGLCVGAGLGVALAADLAYCSDRARFSAIFAKRGLSLDFGTSWLLRQRLSVNKAKELALTAKIVFGPEAHQLGLVNEVVPVEELDSTVAAVVAEIAAGPPIALASIKRQLDDAPSGSLARALEVEALAQAVNVKTDDLREALIAYVERRTPNFEGK